ncbi:MAG: PKD domain-containing protein [Chitinophagaceae bacterium]|nr:MAG: PKD domain-containing protein [Chitinophagaceae bacterium]
MFYVDNQLFEIIKLKWYIYKFKTSRLMAKLYTLFIIFALCSLGVTAQQQTIRCYTQEADSMLRANNPGMSSHQEFEDWLEQKIAQQPPENPAVRTIYTIPTIVHVIHNGENVGTGNNISEAQVISQFEVLNEDFRRIPGTPGFNNDPVGADVEIEFCPVIIDPNGNALAEPGINRIDRNAEGFDAFPYTPNYIDNTVKPNTFWDPELYFNIWVVPISGGILGYAQFPSNSGLLGMPANGGPASTDGIVTRTTAFGRVGNVQAPFDGGRTTTHEVGHWLGLRHIWGDGGCSVDDFCGDTPTAGGPNYGCNVGASSCSSTDMVENYMDYSDDACMNIFTLCQRTRMRTVMTNSPRRLELLNSTVCEPLAPPVVNFEAVVREGCPGLTVEFRDLSSNLPNSWNWNFPGGNPSSSTNQNPIVTYDNLGSFDVTLTATNNAGSNTATEIGYIEILPQATTTILFETFESNSPTLADWQIVNPNNGISWALYNVGGTTPGNTAIGVNFWNYNNVGEEDRLISPLLDFTDYENVELSFEHAYTRYPNFDSDTLKVYVSTDGGTTIGDLIAVFAEDGSGNFATVDDQTASFFPTQDTEWCTNSLYNASGCISLDLSTYDNTNNIRLTFETVSNYSNNLFLDNIKVIGDCNISVTDCNGDVGGTAFIDSCGICAEGNTGLAANADFDDCGVCFGNNADQDCNGDCFGTAVIDNCGVCSGGNTGIIVNADEDCNGDCNGTAFIDNCGVCVEGNTGLTADADLDDCGVCNGNNNDQDCEGVCFGSAFIDACGDCVGGTTGLTPCVILTPPVADFTVDTQNGCSGESLSFEDLSLENPTSWQWEFPGGTPSVSNQQNPEVEYFSPGTYDVTLIATNNDGSDTLTLTNFITISSAQKVDLTIITDCWGSETTWEILDDNGVLVESGGPYADQAGGQTVGYNLCLDIGCYTFFIFDTFGDGMYGSQYGSCNVDGDYFMNDMFSDILFEMTAPNADFGFGTSHSFCINPFALDYDAGISAITSPTTVLCTQDFIPEIELTNFGLQTLTEVDIIYGIDGFPSQSINWSGSLSTGQSETVLLSNINTGGDGQFNFFAFTDSPNGNQDQNVFNDTSEININVFSNPLPLPFTEDFETGFSAQNWQIDNPNNAQSWEIFTVNGNAPGNQAARVPIYTYNAPDARDGLISPPLDFSGQQNIELYFEHAHRRSVTTQADSLIVSVSSDCGATFDRVLAVAENGAGSFATNFTLNADFVPANSEDWCFDGGVGADCFTIDLSAYAGMPNVRIRFETYNDSGNNIYIDNINIFGDACIPTAYRTVNNGDWSDESIWESSCDGVNFAPASSAPQSDENVSVFIQNTHDVTLNTAYNSGSSNEIFIATDASLSMLNANTDFMFSSLQINGLFVMDNPDFLPSGQIEVTNGGIYEHAVDGSVLPVIDWNSGSTFVLSGAENNLSTLSGSGQSFYNFTFDSDLNTNGEFFIDESGFEVLGTLLIESTGGGSVKQSLNSIQVGNIVIEDGIYEISFDLSPKELNISENFSLGSGQFIPQNSLVRFLSDNESGISSTNGNTILFNSLLLDKVALANSLNISANIQAAEIIIVDRGTLRVLNNSIVETSRFEVNNDESELIIQTGSSVEVNP